MEWSSDSLFILCAMHKRGLVQVLTSPVAEHQSGSLDREISNCFLEVHPFSALNALESIISSLGYKSSELFEATYLFGFLHYNE